MMVRVTEWVVLDAAFERVCFSHSQYYIRQPCRVVYYFYSGIANEEVGEGLAYVTRVEI